MTKAELIDKYRDINIDHDWWTWIEADLRSDLDDLGFHLEHMWFSGFYSQGDGACFTGWVTCWKKFCEKEPQFVDTFPNTAIFLQDEGGNYTISHTSRMCHHYSTTHEYIPDIDGVIDVLEGSEAQEAMMRAAIYKAAMVEEDSVAAWLTEYFRSKMCNLYRTMADTYDSLTSDEEVWDAIQANELDKDEETENVAG